MDILGIGFWELLVVFIIALMVFGPRRLPEIAAKAGKIVRDLRSISQGMMSEWQREITVAARLDELQKVREELEAAKQEIGLAKEEITQAQKDVSGQAQEDIKQIKQDVEENVAVVKTSYEQPSTTSEPSPETSPSSEEELPRENKSESISGPESDPLPETDTNSLTRSDDQPQQEAKLPDTLVEEEPPASEPISESSAKVETTDSNGSVSPPAVKEDPPKPSIDASPASVSSKPEEVLNE